MIRVQPAIAASGCFTCAQAATSRSVACVLVAAGAESAGFGAALLFVRFAGSCFCGAATGAMSSGRRRTCACDGTSVTAMKASAEHSSRTVTHVGSHAGGERFPYCARAPKRKPHSAGCTTPHAHGLGARGRAPLRPR